MGGNVKIPVEVQAQIECIDSMLLSLNGLRANVRNVLKKMVDSGGNGSETPQVYSKAQESIDKKIENLLELSENLRLKPAENLKLVNTKGFELPASYLTMDYAHEKLYLKFISAMKWEKKFKRHFYYCSKSFSNIMSSKFPEEGNRFTQIRRKYITMGRSSKGKTQSYEKISDLKTILASLKEQRGLEADICTEYGMITGLLIRLPGVMKVRIAIGQYCSPSSRLLISKAVAFSYEEDLSLTESSRFKVFQCISNIATSAQLFFGHNDDAYFSSFLVWIQSYQNLFTATCTGCHKRLQIDSDEYGFLPPTYRSYKMANGLHLPYHYTCIPNKHITNASL
eukprot:Nk52_evm59s1737 gene=Nk52_evmTU59s1737